jgi:glycosyltransferase involved in cell wall biosynthesis
MVTPKLPTLAIVFPCFNEAENIQSSGLIIRGLLNQLIIEKQIAEDSFLYFVDDGSSDQTWANIKLLREEIGCVRGTKLSRNFGHQTALLSGLTAVTDQCDAAVSIDVDLQQDPEAIRQFVRDFSQGNEIVLGIRHDRQQDSWFKKQTAQLFYRFSKLMGLDIIPNHADYRLLGNKALNALKHHTEPNVFLRALCLNLGFKTSQVYFDVHERKYGSTKYTLSKMLNLALHGITSFSVRPLRLVAAVGLIIFMASLGMSLYVLWSALIAGNVVPGWASTVIPIYFIGGVQLLCLGIIGEYIGQVYMTTKQRPRWITEQTLN